MVVRALLLRRWLELGWLLPFCGLLLRRPFAFCFPAPKDYTTRPKLSLVARQHRLSTKRHVLQKFLNDTALLDETITRDDDSSSSPQIQFHEHLMRMLESRNYQAILTAYEELMAMGKMYRESEQQPRRHWNKRSERIIKLRMMFDVDNETSDLLWSGSTTLHPSNDSYEQVAKALISSIAFDKIGGWEVCRLLQQMLVQVDQFSNSREPNEVQELISACLIEALSKVGDGPSARKIIHLENKRDGDQKKEEAMEEAIKQSNPLQKEAHENDVVSPEEKNSKVANAHHHDRYLRDHELCGSKLNSLVDNAVADRNVLDEELKKEISGVATTTKASNALTYAKQIHTHYSNSQHDTRAAPQSLKLLKQMIKSLEERPHQLEPDMWIFNTVLLIWARSRRADSGEVAEDILQLMHQFGQSRSPSEFPYPNDQSYTFAIDAYANSGQKNSGKKALEILQQLQESGWQPNARCLSTTIEAIFKAGDPIPLHMLTKMIQLNQLGDDSSVINSRTFTKAIVRGDATNALRVLDLLDAVGNDCCGPNVVHYNAAIFCLAKSDLTNRTEIADKLLSRMEKKGIKGNIVTYTAMLTSQKKYEESERWLWRMEDKYGITPNSRSYNSCLLALLNSDTDDVTDRAFALLSRMERLYLGGNSEIQPDLVTYTCIANILRKHGSGEFDVTRQADWLLSRVRQMGYEPDDIFVSAINHLRVANDR